MTVVIVGGHRPERSIVARTQHVEMVYLGSSDLELAVSADDVRGMVVVDPNGHRLGEVEDLVVDAPERRTRLLVVVSGGILGLNTRERLIPVDTITKVDDRVHVDRNHADERALPGQAVDTQTATESAHRPEQASLPSVAEVYRNYGVRPFWNADRGAVYFHLR